jgi:hypothetical protein
MFLEDPGDALKTTRKIAIVGVEPTDDVPRSDRESFVKCMALSAIGFLRPA